MYMLFISYNIIESESSSRDLFENFVKYINDTY